MCKWTHVIEIVKLMGFFLDDTMCVRFFFLCPEVMSNDNKKTCLGSGWINV